MIKVRIDLDGILWAFLFYFALYGRSFLVRRYVCK